MAIAIACAQALAQPPGRPGGSGVRNDDSDRGDGSGSYGGSSGRDEDDATRPSPAPGQAAGEKIAELSDDVTAWRKKDYYNARRVGDPRLKAAVTYLGEHFARVTSGRRNEKAAVLLARLLAADPSSKGSGVGGSGGSPGGYPGMMGQMSGPPSGSGGPPSGPPPGMVSGGPSGSGGPPSGPPPGMMSGGPGMYGSGGSGMSGPSSSGQAQPARPLHPEVITAIVDALLVNGSKPAWKTVTEVLSGTFNSDSDRVATEAALQALLVHLSPEGENLLLTVLVTPEKIRPRGPGETGGAGSSGMYPGSGGYPGSSGPPSGYSGSGMYPGSSGPGGQGKFTATELQTRAIALIEQLAPESFRTKVAKYYVDARTRPEHRALLGRLLLASNPQNVSAQVLLHASPATDKEARARIEGNFVNYSSGTLSMLLGVPFQPHAAQAGSARSGYPGSGSMPQGYPGSGAPRGSGPPSGFRGSGPPAGYPGSGPPPGAAMPPGGSSPDSDDDVSSRSPMNAPYATQPMPSGMQPDAPGAMMTYPGMISGPQGSGYGPMGARGGSRRLAALDPETSCRVAQQLWGAQFTTSLVAELEQIESLQQDAPRILLASTIPTDAVRAKLYQTLRHYHSDGPQALEDAGLGTALFSDPGFLVVLKAMPRKDPAKEKPTRVFRSRRRTEGQGGREGGGQPYGGASGRGQPSVSGYGPGQPYSGQGPGQPKAKEKDLEKPEVAWMAASEDLVRAMCDQLMIAGRPRRGISSAPADLSEGRPIEIPSGTQITLVSEYHFEWPKSLADPGKLSGVPLDAMIVHYVRIQTENTPSKVVSYFKRKLAGPAEHTAEVGYWLETVRSVETTDHKRSIDVLITRREERDTSKAARPGGANPAGPYASMPGYAPQGRSADSDDASGRPSYGGPPGSSGSGRRPGQPGEKPDKDVSGDLIIEVLSVEIKNPAPSEEAAKSPRTAKAASKDEG